jgi:hypothetical protein
MQEFMLITGEPWKAKLIALGWLVVAIKVRFAEVKEA